MPETRDPGLQPERTLLAWRRTTLVLVVNALLLFRSGWLHDQEWLMVAGALLGLTALVSFFLLGTRHTVFASAKPQLRVEARMVAGFTILTVVTCVVALAALLTS